MVDVTKHLTNEVDELAESFKQLEAQQAAAVKALRKKLPRFAMKFTDRELKQVVNIVLDVYN